MKKKYAVLICFLMLGVFINAQYKDKADLSKDIRNGLLAPAHPENLFGFINPENFSMSHTIGMSYSAFSGQGVAMGVYTNKMKYDFSDKVNVELDASIVNTPYNTLGDNFTNNINGIYLSKAALNYRPSDKTYISLEFRQLPAGVSPFMTGSCYRDFYHGDW